MVKNHGFCSFTKNKLVNEAANDSARVSGKDREKYINCLDSKIP